MNNYTDDYSKSSSQKSIMLCLLISGVIILLGLIACLVVLLLDGSEVADKSVDVTPVVHSAVNSQQNSNKNNYVVKNEGGRFYDSNNSANNGLYSSGGSSDGGSSSALDDSNPQKPYNSQPQDNSDNEQRNNPDNTPDTQEHENHDGENDAPDSGRRGGSGDSSQMQGLSMRDYLGLTLEEVHQGMNCDYSLIAPYEGTINGVRFDVLPFLFYFYSHDGYMGEPRPTEEIYMVYFDSSTSNKMLVDENFTSYSTYAEIKSEGNGELVENRLDGGYIYVHQGDGYNVSFLWHERPSDNKTPDTICVTQQIN